MFPLSFPYGILRANAEPGDIVLDPFCGRGTTNYASRLLGLASFGIDSSAVAAALSKAKLANTSPADIIEAATKILGQGAEPSNVPQGEFWDWAFDRGVLRQICVLRESLLTDCVSDARKALRAIVMGALHGPQAKARQSYFSNQAPRTYAPKPRYSVGFWKRLNLRPLAVDVIDIIQVRALRYYGLEDSRGRGAIVEADSRHLNSYVGLLGGHRPQWVITSPPYYGMRMYRPDQWLRGWFVGGPPNVDYSSEAQLAHTSPRTFVSELRRAWRLSAEVCAPGAKLVVRFGGIRDRKADPLALVIASFSESGWIIRSIRSAGFASSGKRQADHFARPETTALEEHDVWAVRT